MKLYICNKDFPNLGLEVGDYFPVENFSKKAIESAVREGKIIEENDN